MTYEEKYLPEHEERYFAEVVGFSRSVVSKRTGINIYLQDEKAQTSTPFISIYSQVDYDAFERYEKELAWSSSAITRHEVPQRFKKWFRTFKARTDLTRQTKYLFLSRTDLLTDFVVLTLDQEAYLVAVKTTRGDVFTCDFIHYAGSLYDECVEESIGGFFEWLMMRLGIGGTK